MLTTHIQFFNYLITKDFYYEIVPECYIFIVNLIHEQNTSEKKENVPKIISRIILLVIMQVQ